MTLRTIVLLLSVFWAAFGALASDYSTSIAAMCLLMSSGMLVAATVPPMIGGAL